MSSTETRPRWNGSALDLLNRYLAINEFRLCHFTISDDVLLEFDELLAIHINIPYHRLP